MFLEDKIQRDTKKDVFIENVSNFAERKMWQTVKNDLTECHFSEHFPWKKLKNFSEFSLIC